MKAHSGAGSFSHMDELASSGCVIVPAGCEPEFIAAVLNVSLQMIDKVWPRWAKGKSVSAVQQDSTKSCNVHQADGTFRSRRRNSASMTANCRGGRWWKLRLASMPNTRSAASSIRNPARAQEWHMDSPHESVEHLPAHALNVLVALQDVSIEMGPTEFAPGSHMLTNHLSNPSLVRDELIYQHATTSPAMLVKGKDQAVPASSVDEMPTGTWALFDDRLLHRGLANQSDVTRYMAYFSYRTRGYAENTHFEAQRSVFD